MANERARSINIRELDGWTSPRKHPLSPNQKDHETTLEWEAILARFDHRIENFYDYYGTRRIESPERDLTAVQPTQLSRPSPQHTIEITQLLKAS